MTTTTGAMRLPSLGYASTAVILLALPAACAKRGARRGSGKPVAAPVCRAGRADALGFLLLLGRLGGGRLSGGRVSGRRLLLRGLLSG